MPKKTTGKGGVDRRTRRTRAALADALMELAPQTGLQALEVSALTAKAGVARSTFYKHYADKDDFMVTSFAGMVQMADEAARARGLDGVLPARHVFAHVESARTFALSLAASGEFAKAQAAREAKLVPIAEANLARLKPAMTQARRRDVATFLVGAFMGTLRAWMDDGLRQSAQHVAGVFETLAARVLAGEA